MNEFLRDSEVRKILKIVYFVLGALLVWIVLSAISAGKEIKDYTYQNNSISVIGYGSSTSTPNVATFNFSVTNDAKTVVEAENNIATKVTAILAGLKDQGIESKDIQTKNYEVYPKYLYQSSTCTNGVCGPTKQIPDGYTVSEYVAVKVRQTADAGKALALVGEKGATNISNLAFVLEDPNAPMNDARLNAIADARTNAEAIAAKLGVTLGKVTAYFDNPDNQPRPYAMFGAQGKATTGAMAVPIEVGENKTTATVTVTFEIR